MSVCERKRLRSTLSGALPEIIFVMIAYIQLTEEQLSDYEADPSMYAVDEDEDGLSFSVRSAANQLVQEICRQFGTNALEALQIAVQNRLSVTEMSWKLKEAIFFAVGSGFRAWNEVVTQEDDDAVQIPFAIDEFTQVIASETQSSISLLKGRTIWTGAALMSIVAQTPDRVEWTKELGTLAASCVRDPHSDLPLRLLSAKVLGIISAVLPAGYLAQDLETVIPALFELIPHLEEDALYLILDTVASLIPLNPESSARIGAVIANGTCQVWYQNYSDPVVSQLVTLIVSELAKLPNIAEGLQSVFARPIFEAMDKPDPKLPGILETAVEILGLIVFQSPWPLQEAMNPLFPMLIQYMMTTQDSSLLQFGSAAVVAYLKSGGERLAEWNDGTASAFSYVLRVIERLLGPDVTSEGALLAGNVVSKLFDTVSRSLEK